MTNCYICGDELDIPDRPTQDDIEPPVFVAHRTPDDETYDRLGAIQHDFVCSEICMKEYMSEEVRA